MNIDQRIKTFHSFLSHDVPSIFNVRLGGSWETGEFHVIKNHDFLMSYSDVDYTISGGYSSLAYASICRMVLEKTNSLNISLAGAVSLRDRGEWIQLWDKSNFAKQEISDVICHSDFILFWSWVACIETILAQRESLTESWRRYQLTKLFLRIWRIFTISKIGVTSSWENGLSYAKNLIGHHDCHNLLQIKKGGAAGCEWERLLNINLACIKKAFLLEKIPLSNDLWSLIESISTENNNEKILHVFLYLSHAKKFILNGSAQEAALIRLEQKWKKTLDSQQLFFF